MTRKTLIASIAMAKGGYDQLDSVKADARGKTLLELLEMRNAALRRPDNTVKLQGAVNDR